MSTIHKLPTIYLAGAIRDNRLDDIAWRERVIAALYTRAIFLNPLGGKTYSKSTGGWEMSGIPSLASRIVKHDFWAVDHADIVLANMSSLSEGYPSLGSLIELGRATKTGALIYIILDPNYLGHSNGGMYKLHPFLEQIAAAHFDTVLAAISFLHRHLQVLSGENPSFDGEVE